MDILLERDIVKTFFNKRYQERVIYELNSKKKRLEAISRLCHDYESILNYNYMEKVDSTYDNEILKILKKYGALENCYVISYNRIVDGTYMKLDEALKNIVGYGMPSLVICVPSKLVYFEAEQIDGAPPRYILKK